jgi:hypothetical protein
LSVVSWDVKFDHAVLGPGYQTRHTVDDIVIDGELCGQHGWRCGTWWEEAEKTEFELFPPF